MATFRIHTYVLNTDAPLQTHSWVSLSGQSYSLYPKDNPSVLERGKPDGWNGSGTDVQEGLDNQLEATQTRTMEIGATQEADLQAYLHKPQEYSGLFNNCSHFAAEAWRVGTGEELSIRSNIKVGNSEGLGSSPVGLEASIQEKNSQFAVSSRIEESPTKMDREGVSEEQQSADHTETSRQEPASEKHADSQPLEGKSLAELKAEMKASLKGDRPPPPPPPPPPSQGSGFSI